MTQTYNTSLFLLILVLVLLAEDVHKVLAHEVFPLLGPVVPLAVLQEAEEEGVDSHGIDVKEGAGYEEGGNGDDDDRGEVVVHLGKVRSDTRHLPAEDEEGSHAEAAHHDHLANEEEEICDL